MRDHTVDMSVKDISYSIAYSYIYYTDFNYNFLIFVDPEGFEMYPRPTNKVKGMLIIGK